MKTDFFFQIYLLIVLNKLSVNGYDQIKKEEIGVAHIIHWRNKKCLQNLVAALLNTNKISDSKKPGKFLTISVINDF